MAHVRSSTVVPAAAWLALALAVVVSAAGCRRAAVVAEAPRLDESVAVDARPAVVADGSAPPGLRPRAHAASLNRTAVDSVPIAISRHGAANAVPIAAHVLLTASHALPRHDRGIMLVGALVRPYEVRVRGLPAAAFVEGAFDRPSLTEGDWAIVELRGGPGLETPFLFVESAPRPGDRLLVVGWRWNDDGATAERVVVGGTVVEGRESLEDVLFFRTPRNEPLPSLSGAAVVLADDPTRLVGCYLGHITYDPDPDGEVWGAGVVRLVPEVARRPLPSRHARR